MIAGRCVRTYIWMAKTSLMWRTLHFGQSVMMSILKPSPWSDLDRSASTDRRSVGQTPNWIGAYQCECRVDLVGDYYSRVLTIDEVSFSSLRNTGSGENLYPETTVAIRSGAFPPTPNTTGRRKTQGCYAHPERKLRQRMLKERPSSLMARDVRLRR
jgi:hypothetical protein